MLKLRQCKVRRLLRIAHVWPLAAEARFCSSATTDNACGRAGSSSPETSPGQRATTTRQIAARRAPSATMRRRQAALGDLRKQRLVADPENPRGLGTVPANGIEHFQKRLALGLSRPAASNLLEAALDDGGLRRSGVPVVPVAAAGHQGLDRLLAVSQHHPPAGC